jgi:HK97 family phage portal protein
MKIISNVVRLDNFKKQYGSWDIQTRKRQGLHYNSDYYSSSVVGVGLDRYTDRILSDSDLYTVYKRCSDVRASVDSIVRRVATFDWMVVPKVNPQNPKYAELMEICKMTNDFLLRPNRNGDTWQEIMTSMLTDCLVFDAGVLELVYDMSGNLQELVPLRGSTISPIIDEFGRLIHYQQNIFEEGTYFSTPSADNIEDTQFKAKQILYLSLFKNTATPEGFPIIESLVNEVIGLLRATEHAMLNLDADEVPPGILVLAGIAGKAAEEAKADLQRLKGQDHKVRVMTTPDPTGVGAKWLELRRQPKDIQMNEVIEQLRRTVYRTFGVMPVEMGMTQGMPKSTASVQMDVASSHLVTPMLELIQAKINAQIIPAVVNSKEVANLIEFKFDRESRLSPQEQLNLASTYRNYVTQGIMTRNEIRETLGLLPIIGGDVPTVEVAGMPQALESIITGYQSAAPPSETIQTEIGDTLEDMEDKKEEPQFGNGPIDKYDLLANRSEELIANDISIDETINNISISVKNNKYYIEGERLDNITLAKGFTYIFDQSDKSNKSFQIYFSLDSEGKKEYVTGIKRIGTAGEDGSQLRMVTDLKSPSILYLNGRISNMSVKITFQGKLIDTEDTEYKVLNKNKRSLGIYGPVNSDVFNATIDPRYDLNYPLIGYPSDHDTLFELRQLIGLEYKRNSDKEFIELADRDLVLCFIEFMKSTSIKDNEISKTHKIMNEISKNSAPAIMKLKYYFNRPRPYQVAERLGLDFEAMDSKTAHTPSYPSGHTIQSYLIAFKLSNMYPKYRNDFFSIAKRISESRMIAGYHFKSDIEYGITIFRFIVNSKEN